MRIATSDAITVRVVFWRLICNSGAMLGLAVLILLATTHSSEARSLQWAKQAGATETEVGSSIAVDGSRNSYVTGYFEGSTTLGLGEANQTTLVATGASDIFMAKYNPSGDLLWAKRAGGTGYDDAFGIAVDGSGNSYVTGYFEGSATFGLGEANQTTLVSTGASDIFVAKYNPSGALLWAKRAGGAGSGQGFGIRVDGTGNSYVTGSFEGSVTFGLGEANQKTLTSDGDFDIFVAKYNSSGALLWAKRTGGTGFDEGFGIALDGSGNSYVTGYFEGSATFGLGEANQAVLTSSGSSDMFVAKYNPSGSLLWAKRAGGTGFVEGFGIMMDGSGNSYVTGTFSETATFGLGEANQTVMASVGGFDIFIAKYSSSGALLWSKQTVGTGFVEGYGIAVDGSGNSYVTGYFDGSVTFGSAEANQTILTSVGGFDIFVAKYSASGSLLWAKRAGGTSFEVGVGIAVDGSSNAYLTGYFDGVATFGLGEANQTALTSAGSYDIFIAKFAGNRTAGDFDGDGKSDITVFRGGAWLMHDFTSGTQNGAVWTGTSAGCFPVAMDYDGDGKIDFTQFCNGAWHFYNSNGSYNKGIWTGGVAGDLPVPADYDGDGKDDVVVYRGGAWLFYNFATGVFDAAKSRWTGGGGSCIPVPMDYNGDGKADFTQLCSGAWHFHNDNGSYNKGIWTGGVAGDLPVPADYDGDGIDDVVVFRGGAWLFYNFATGAYDAAKSVWTGAPPHWTGGITLPAPMDYDGNGKADFTVYSGGPWYFFNGNGTFNKGIWTGGGAGDQPISKRLLP